MGAVEVDGPRGDFEDRLHRLRDRRVETVDYWDVHNFSAEPASWDYGDWHHAVMGVQLGTDQGPVTVTWANTFYPYGVEVFHEPIHRHLVLGESGPQRVGPDVHVGTAWAALLESPIRGTACHWERVQIGPGRRADGSFAAPAYSVDVPVALRLDFAAAVVWFVAGIPQLPELRRPRVPSTLPMTSLVSSALSLPRVELDQRGWPPRRTASGNEDVCGLDDAGMVLDG
jgi:hypothetical protein